MECLKHLMETSQTCQYTTDNDCVDEFGFPILSNFLPLRENEVIKGGMIYCSVCDTPKIYVGENWRGKLVARRCVCECYEIERQKQTEEEMRKEKLLRIEKLKNMSLIGERYKGKHFSDLDLSNKDFTEVYKRCKKYCEVADEVYKNGYGMYLYGNSGTGKTLLTACMANELMEKEYSVLFTNFFEINRAIRNTYSGKTNETDNNIINNIANADFLFIDDFGTESLSKNNGDNFTQDKIFEIINKRYNNVKPTIFSSNYSLKDLITNRGFTSKTIDRVNEMATAVIELKGKSYRAKKLDNQELIF